MEKITEETDLLGEEDPRVTRKSLLPAWFRVCLLLLAICMTWVALHSLYVFVKQYMEAGILNPAALITMAVEFALHFLEIFTCVALLREKNYAAVLGVVMGIAVVVLGISFLVASYYIYRRLGLRSWDYVRIMWPMVLRIAAFAGILILCWKLRRQWRGAAPSYARS